MVTFRRVESRRVDFGTSFCWLVSKATPQVWSRHLSNYREDSGLNWLSITATLRWLQVDFGLKHGAESSLHRGQKNEEDYLVQEFGQRPLGAPLGYNPKPSRFLSRATGGRKEAGILPPRPTEESRRLWVISQWRSKRPLAELLDRIIFLVISTWTGFKSSHELNRARILPQSYW